ncbi:MAG TPA: metallophosphoesterase family protein [Patescibacteria group bacterium]|nr:metallophosphoesterase family protein [Patescibacteria group bacterium]
MLRHLHRLGRRWFSRTSIEAGEGDPFLVYAIGDIHGEIAALDCLLRRIVADAATRPEVLPELVFLGDYVDRGADSRAVVERLSGLALPGFTLHTLMGNHEAAMLDFLADPGRGASWLAYGGAETLVSYGVRASFGISDPARCQELRDQLLARLPDHHWEFLKGLLPQVVLGDYLFVHAGIRPGRSIAAQRPEDVLWIREPFLSSRRRHEKVVVHGHTVTEQPELLSNRIGIDTGAFATGTLTAVALSENNPRLLQVFRKDWMVLSEDSRHQPPEKYCIPL